MSKISIKFGNTRWGWTIALLLTGIPCFAQGTAQPEQPLAKAAQSKPARKARLVFTDDNLPRGPEARRDEVPAVAEPESTAHADKTREQTKPPDRSEPNPSDSSAQEAHSRIESLKHDERVLTEKYDQIQRKLAETNDESLRRIYSDALSKRDERLERVRKQIEEAERALSAAETPQVQGDK